MRPLRVTVFLDTMALPVNALNLSSSTTKTDLGEFLPSLGDLRLDTRYIFWDHGAVAYGG